MVSKPSVRTLVRTLQPATTLSTTFTLSPPGKYKSKVACTINDIRDTIKDRNAAILVAVARTTVAFACHGV